MRVCLKVLSHANISFDTFFFFFLALERAMILSRISRLRNDLKLLLYILGLRFYLSFLVSLTLLLYTRSFSLWIKPVTASILRALCLASVITKISNQPWWHGWWLLASKSLINNIIWPSLSWRITCVYSKFKSTTQNLWAKITTIGV